MSELQEIAAKLRALATSTDPLAGNVIASARKLKSIAAEVGSLKKSGVDVSNLSGALDAAITAALKAERSVRLIRSEGTAWADTLAAGHGGGAVGTNLSALPVARTGTTSGWARTLRPFLSPAANLMLLKAFISPEVAELWLPVAVEASAPAFLGEAAAEVLKEITDGLFKLHSEGVREPWMRGVIAHWRSIMDRRFHSR